MKLQAKLTCPVKYVIPEKKPNPSPPPPKKKRKKERNKQTNKQANKPTTHNGTFNVPIKSGFHWSYITIESLSLLEAITVYT